jgi:superfamily II DNA or RNA helicase
MTAQLALRPYQTEALAGLAADWDAGLVRLAIVLPTGLGKTVVFAHLIRQALAEGRRPIVLVHREELAQQAAEKIRAVAPDVEVGIVKAERDEVSADVVVASVPTLARQRRMGRYLAATVGAKRLVVVDECHHAAARTWVEVLTALGAFGATATDTPAPDTLVAGFTATMSREDGRGLGDIWEKVSYTRDILYGIDNGYLTDVRGKAVTVDGLDLGTVARSRGDYQDGQLGEALEKSGAGEVIANAYVEHASDRPGVLFAPTVATAHSFADDLNAAGIRTEVITGTTSTEDRNLIYKRYAAGDTQVLSNCMVLTEGWDAPFASCAVIARPTSSAGLYTQMVGRVLRPFPGKADALVLDVVGVAARHALRSIVDLTKTNVTVEDGESLAEAIEREAAERESRPADKGRAAGIIAAQDVDLFHRSTSVWLQTEDGKWFIPTRDWTYFLWPQTGGTLWNIGRVPTFQAQRRDRTLRGGWVREGLDIGYAMALGEAEAASTDSTVSSKSASWRTRKQGPSDAQLAMSASWRIEITEGMTKAQVSDLISIKIATKDLKRFKVGQ